MSDGQGTFAGAGDRWYEALNWHTRLREASESELPPDIQAWQEWVSDDRNRVIFDQVSRLLEDRAHYRKRRLLSTADIDNNLSNPTVGLTQWRQDRASPLTERPTTHAVWQSKVSRLVAVAAAVVAVLSGLLVSLLIPQPLWQTDAPNVRPQLQQTASGEVRSLRLEDGSNVTLGAQSAISVQFSPERRSVTLERGQAWFQVAHNAARPFVVTAGARTITAVGTAFVVQRDSDRVVVTVTEGSVDVAPQPSTDEASPAVGAVRAVKHVAPARVARGEQMSYEDTGSASAVDRTDPQAATAWSEGRLEFDHEPLRYVVQVVNRYSHRTITLDQASGNLLYTGLVFQDQIDDWICGLEGIYAVEVVEHGEQVWVRPRGQAPVQVPSRCGNAN